MTRFLSQFVCKIGGALVPMDFSDDLLEVVVDTSLLLPDMFEILLDDNDLVWVDSDLLDIGKDVEITAIAEGQDGGSSGKLITGQITAIEPQFSATQGTTMRIRGYDRSHRLHRGHITRTFNKQRDEDIVARVAKEVGLRANTDPTDITYDYVLQNNQTNMQFLAARAERIGYQLLVSDGTLYFKRASFCLGNGPDLVFAENLISFYPCWSSAGQGNEVVVKSWDPKAKSAIRSASSASSSLCQGGMAQTGSATATSAFGIAPISITDRPALTSAEAKAIAQGMSDAMGKRYVRATGVCEGDPRVKAGWKVTIKRVGKRFSGEYWITSAKHVYGRDGYRTHLSISGLEPESLSRLLRVRDTSAQPMPGVATALVTNLSDPENLGRVKVKYGWLGRGPAGAEIETDWARIATPMAGKKRGFMYLPEINDEVLVAFEHGDVHRPYLIGCLWSKADPPPMGNDQVAPHGKVEQRIIRSSSGHLIILDDTAGKEKIVIRDKTNKNELVIDSANNSMSIKVDGDFCVEAKGRITLSSAKDMALESGARSSIKSKSSMQLETQASGTFAGTQLAVQAKGKSTVQGAQVEVAGTGQVAVKSGGMAAIQAMTVKIN